MKYLKIWNIDYGGLTREELLLKLAKRKVAMNAYATLLFLNERFVEPSSKSSANVVSISPTDLGIKKKVTFSEICRESIKRGFHLCPLEMAPMLRLVYLDQEEGPMLTVATEVVYHDEELPNGFYLQNSKGNLWLRGYRSSEDWLWDQTSDFVFIDPNV